MEFNKENLDYVLNIFKENGVKYNTNIDKYFNNPASEPETEEIAEDLFKLLHDSAISGVNNGFNSNKKDIYEITDYIVAQSDSKAYKNVKDSIKAKNRLANDLKIIKKEDRAITDEFKDFIERTIDNTNVFLNKSKTIKADDKRLVKKGVELLEEMKSLCDELIDYTSLKAKQFQANSYLYIKDWATTITGESFTDNTDLEKAIIELKKWSQLVKYEPDKSKTNPMEMGITDIDRVASSLEGALNDYEGIKKSFEYKREQFEQEKAELEKLRDDINAQEAEVAKVKDEMKAVGMALANNAIDYSTAQSKIINLQNKEKNMNILINVQKPTLRNMENSFQAKETKYALFKAQFIQIDAMAKNPLYFYIATRTKGIDMKIIRDYFAGRLISAEQTDEAVFQIEQLTNAYNDQVRRDIEIQTGIMEGQHVVKTEENNKLNQIIEEQNKADKQQADDFLKQFLNNNQNNEPQVADIENVSSIG